MSITKSVPEEKRRMRTKSRIILTAVIAAVLTAVQPLYAQRTMERLDRGLIAVKTTSGYFVSWRLFGTDPEDIGFNVYKGTTKLNSTVITNATCYQDNSSGNGAYTIRPVVGGTEQAASPAARVLSTNYLSIPISAPASGYSAGDASAADLDGDGEYEIVLKWEHTPKDNSQQDVTQTTILDAYKLDGTRMWRIDLGKNIREGAHYTQFMVYDLDSDGKAEMACKTAPGTKDGKGSFLRTGPAANDNDAADYRTGGSWAGFITTGPEYLTIFNGQTGAELITVNYVPDRNPSDGWGKAGDNTNRVDRFLACVAYLDGEKPSLVMCRGYYGRTVLAAWDWRNNTLTQRWVFDSNASGNGNAAGQGNHNLSVGDVDNDRKDEIVYGACTIDDNGTLKGTTRVGHGDAGHLSDIDPDRPGLEYFSCHEGGACVDLRDPSGSSVIWSKPGNGDVGRGCAADLTAAHKGMECWGSGGLGLYTCKGASAGAIPSIINHVIWWDGDLLRELLDGNHIDKYPSGRLLTADGCASINGTKSNPCLQVDIFGDWREEVIFKTTNSSELRIYTTTVPTTNRLYTLMHDPQYRLSIAWQNVAYNQPPHTGFYLGEGMSPAPRPNITLVGGPRFSLSSSVAEGQGSISPASGNFDANSSVTVTAAGAEGFIFDHWGGDLSGNTNPATITMNEDKTISAFFAVDNRPYYSIDVQATPGGKLTQSPEGKRLPEGSQVSWTVVADSGWKFAGWSGDQTGDNAQLTVTSLNSDLKLTATFMPVNPKFYEAEYGTIISGVKEATNAGFSGTGYANVNNEIGSSVEILVYSADAGQKSILLTFANGTSSARTFSVAVNGTQVLNSLSFDPTGAWTTWGEKAISLNLLKGHNTIKFTSTTADGGPNLDKLEIVSFTRAINAVAVLKEGVSFCGNSIKINSRSSGSTVTVNLFSLAGRKIFSREITLANGTGTISLPELKTGSYLLKANINGTVHTKKISRVK